MISARESVITAKHDLKAKEFDVKSLSYAQHITFVGPKERSNYKSLYFTI
jgi:hypothetical protein